MLGSLITGLVELTGKTIGYVADEVADIADAVSNSVDTFTEAYESTNKPKPDAETPQDSE